MITTQRIIWQYLVINRTCILILIQPKRYLRAHCRCKIRRLATYKLKLIYNNFPLFWIQSNNDRNKPNLQQVKLKSQSLKEKVNDSSKLYNKIQNRFLYHFVVQKKEDINLLKILNKQDAQTMNELFNKNSIYN